MGFSLEQGYTPTTIDTMMLSVMDNVNVQFGTAYTMETFIGTNLYKYFYALMQRLQENEIKTSEIFLLLQDYFKLTNENISRPVVTNPGLLEHFQDEGFIVSIKKPINTDAGKVFVAVDVDEDADDYEDVRLEIATIIRDSTVAGVVSQGTEIETLTLSNGQAFDFKFNLPNRIPVKLKLTVELSENNQVVIGAPDDTKLKLLSNILSRYRLGRNFEPQRYFTTVDAPWAASVLLEWSDDAGSSWHDEVFDAEYDDLFVFALADITLVEV